MSGEPLTINRLRPSNYPALATDRLKAGLVCFLLSLLPCFVESTLAASPSPFNAEYEAKYGGFKASAERSLFFSENGQIEMTTSLKLKLLGKTLSSITEQSILDSDPQNNQFRPVDYSFTQTGIGKRRRQINFDWEAGTALYDDGKNEIETPLQVGLADNLSSYLEVSKQLQAGKQDIFFPVIDKGNIEQLHFKVLGEELISTRSGNFRTIKIEKIRGPDSKRTTEMWLALYWDYLLVKLVQIENGGSNISLELKRATVNDVVVTAVDEKDTAQGINEK